MTLERAIRLIAGTFVLASLALAHWRDPRWLWFTAFVGANLLQSSLTRWCLMEDILSYLQSRGWITFSPDCPRSGGSPGKS